MRKRTVWYGRDDLDNYWIFKQRPETWVDLGGLFHFCMNQDVIHCTFKLVPLKKRQVKKLTIIEEVQK